MLVGMDVIIKHLGEQRNRYLLFISTTDKHYSKFYLILFLNFLITV